MNKDNTTILKEIGLDEKEIQLYLVLLSSGVQTIKQISAAANMNRTTAYRFLTVLKTRGLVEWIVGPRGALIQAAPPAALNLYIQDQKRQLARLEAVLPAAITSLAQLRARKKFSTRVRYFEGELGIKQMIWNSLQTEGQSRSYTMFKRREVISPSFEDDFEEQWAKKSLKDMIITNETRGEYIAYKLVPDFRKGNEIRIIPSTVYNITSDIIIYNNVFAIMSLEKDNLVGVEIENAEIARTQKSIFDIVWRVAKPAYHILTNHTNLV
jgi:sugar-specific transcriptional regulator TrmB